MYMVSYPLPHEDGRGCTFQGQWGFYSRGTLSYETYGGVTIRDFPGGNADPISYPIGKCRTKSIKVNLTNFHREIYRIKFYVIVTSDVR